MLLVDLSDEVVVAVVAVGLRIHSVVNTGLLLSCLEEQAYSHQSCPCIYLRSGIVMWAIERRNKSSEGWEEAAACSRDSAAAR